MAIPKYKKIVVVTKLTYDLLKMLDMICKNKKRRKSKRNKKFIITFH